jgi:DNA-binding MarR family transcriptional regulator
MTYDGEKIEGLEITITEDMIKDGLEGYDLIIYALIKDLEGVSDAVFSPDAKEVAECLNISTAKAMESLNHLVSMGFIYKEVMKADREVLAIEYHMPEDKTRRKLSRTTVNDTNTLVSVTIENPARQ